MRAETLNEAIHGKAAAGGDYVAAGEENVDTDEDGNGSSEFRGRGRGRQYRAEEEVRNRQGEGKSKNKQRRKGKGKATPSLNDQLLQPVSERDTENSGRIGTIEHGDSSTIRKQDAIPSGSTAQSIVWANVRGVRWRPGSISSVDAPGGHFLEDGQTEVKNLHNSFLVLHYYGCSLVLGKWNFTRVLLVMVPIYMFLVLEGAFVAVVYLWLNLPDFRDTFPE